MGIDAGIKALIAQGVEERIGVAEWDCGAAHTFDSPLCAQADWRRRQWSPEALPDKNDRPSLATRLTSQLTGLDAE